MNTPGLITLAVLSAVILFSQRRWALLALLASTLYLYQYRVIPGFFINIFPHRLIEIAGVVRIIWRKEIGLTCFSKLDKSVMLFYVYCLFMYFCRLIYESSPIDYSIVGKFIDFLLVYVISISLINNIKDFKWLLKNFVILLFPYVALIVYEHFLSYNPFVFLGASPAHIYRNGVPRCMGTFRAAILLGTLGASFLPLYIGLYLSEAKSRIYSAIGIIHCVLIVLLANSGGPVTATGVGIISWLLWGCRKNMYIVRRFIMASLILLALVMKAPIWFLPAKISSITGGDGYHRSVLMDRAIKTIDKWWFFGMPFENTRDWFPYINQASGRADITNVYVQIGLTAGIGAIISLLIVLIQAYKYIGKALSVLMANNGIPSQDIYLLWGLGVTLTVHIITWLSVTYFDQFYIVWCVQLAAISKVTQNIISSNEETEDSLECQCSTKIKRVFWHNNCIFF